MPAGENDPDFSCSNIEQEGLAQLPILYSFRRCPYAMRARLALHYANVQVEHREVLLRDKPLALLNASAKGTVPVLILDDGRVLDQSLDIMRWALRQHDPEDWQGKRHTKTQRQWAEALIAENDGAFKSAIDRYKYCDRFPDAPPETYRKQAEPFLEKMESALREHAFVMDQHVDLADVAIFPFVRQFAGVDRRWFESAGFDQVVTWLRGFETSRRFSAVMQKQPRWHDDSVSGEREP